MTDYNYQPLDFSGILKHGWNLTLRTAIGAGIPALILLLPLGMAVGHFGKEFFSSLALLIEHYGIPVDSPPSEGFIREYVTLIRPMFLYGIMIFFYIIGGLYIQSIATRLSWEAVGGRSPGIAEGLHNSFGRTFWNNILQSLFLGIIAGMAMIASSIFQAFGRTIGPMFEVIPLVALYGIAFYFTVATVFRVHELVVDGRGPWQGLIASMALVRRHWWRVASLVLLIGILGVVLTSVLPQLFIPGSAYQDAVRPGFPPSGEYDPKVIAAMFKEVAHSITLVSTLIQSIAIPVVLLFGINLLTAKYVDLRVRRGDFDEEIGPDGEMMV
jgi:hypothetical protein